MTTLNSSFISVAFKYFKSSSKIFTSVSIRYLNPFDKSNENQYSYGTLRYPLNLGTTEEYGHYILFHIFERTNSKYHGPQEVEETIKLNNSEHKEAGFDYGWPSRFDTQFKFLMELGFLYYSPPGTSSLGEKNAEKIIISE